MKNTNIIGKKITFSQYHQSITHINDVHFTPGKNEQQYITFLYTFFPGSNEIHRHKKSLDHPSHI
jgi:hypothetical protein